MERRCIVCDNKLSKSEKCSVCGFIVPRVYKEISERYNLFLRETAASYRDTYFPEFTVGLTTWIFNWNEELQELCPCGTKDMIIAALPRYRLPEYILWAKEPCDSVSGYSTRNLHLFIDENGIRRYLDLDMDFPSKGRFMKIGVKMIDRRYLCIALSNGDDVVYSMPVLYHDGKVMNLTGTPTARS